MSLIDEALRRAQAEAQQRLLREQGVPPLGAPARGRGAGAGLRFGLVIATGAVVVAGAAFALQRWDEVVGTVRGLLPGVAVRGEGVRAGAARVHHDTGAAATAVDTAGAPEGEGAPAVVLADTAAVAAGVEGQAPSPPVTAELADLPVTVEGGRRAASSPDRAAPAAAVAGPRRPARDGRGAVAGAAAAGTVQGGSGSGGGEAAGTHTVAAGETLWGIARRYGVSVDSLRAWNGVEAGQALAAGQRLRVVGGGRGAAGTPAAADRAAAAQADTAGALGPAAASARAEAAAEPKRAGAGPVAAERVEAADTAVKRPEPGAPVLDVRRRAGEDDRVASRRVEAERVFQEAVRLREIGDLEGAMARYERALQLDSGYVAAYNDLGVLLHRRGRSQEALAMLDAALRLKPDYARAVINRGIVLMELDRYDQALDAFRTAVLLDPKNVSGYVNLGIVYKRLGRTAEARQVLEAALGIDGTSGEAHYNLARLLEAEGHIELAITHYSRFLESDAGSLELRLQVQTHVERLRRYLRR